MSKCTSRDEGIDKSYQRTKEKLIRRVIEQFGEFRKVVRMTTGEAFKVPTRDIIEKGIQEQDLDQYPKWEDSAYNRGYTQRRMIDDEIMGW